MADIDMFIINDYSQASIRTYNELSSRVTFPVYQDTPQLRLWSQVYRGDKDDFFIFDRCGKMTFHIRFPLSYLGHSHTQQALFTTYHENPCNCHINRRQTHRHRPRNRQSQRQQDPHDQMQGDAPMQIHHGSRPRSYRCRGDPICRIYHRLMNQNSHRGSRNNNMFRHRQY